MDRPARGGDDGAAVVGSKVGLGAPAGREQDVWALQRQIWAGGAGDFENLCGDADDRGDDHFFKRRSGAIGYLFVAGKERVRDSPCGRTAGVQAYRGSALREVPMSHVEHKEASGGIQARCAVITLSDTRSEATDTSGAKIKSLLGGEHHLVNFYSIIPDEPRELTMLLEELISSGDVDVILTNGGTGISRRDHTIPVIEKHLTTILTGFGELFRMLSYQQIGSSAMMSRAVAGI